MASSSSCSAGLNPGAASGASDSSSSSSRRQQQRRTRTSRTTTTSTTRSGGPRGGPRPFRQSWRLRPYPAPPQPEDETSLLERRLDGGIPTTGQQQEGAPSPPVAATSYSTFSLSGTAATAASSSDTGSSSDSDSNGSRDSKNSGRGGEQECQHRRRGGPGPIPSPPPRGLAFFLAQLSGILGGPVVPLRCCAFLELQQPKRRRRHHHHQLDGAHKNGGGGGGSCNKQQQQHQPPPVRCHQVSRWKFVVIIVACAAAAAGGYCRQLASESGGGVGGSASASQRWQQWRTSGGSGGAGVGLFLRWVYEAPEWRWDHNVYSPASSSNNNYQPSASSVTPLAQYSGLPATASSPSVAAEILEQPAAPLSSSSGLLPQQQAASSPASPRNLLLTQIAGTRALKDLGEISSRPNRAYARQWGRDFALFWRKGSLTSKSCFDKAVVLNTIMDRQRSYAGVAGAGDVGGGISPYSPPSPSPPAQQRIVYDAIALLPPDAIVTNLDYDLLGLMPDDKLVSIAGWDGGGYSPRHSSSSSSSSKTSSGTGIIFFNLRHRHADAVSRLWWDMVSPADITCGAGNDLQLLLLAIEAVMGDDEDLESLVVGLNETDQGFVGTHDCRRVIKGVLPIVPSSKEVMLVSNFADVKKKLHTTADSVCYRYYPKCEVL